MEQSRCARILVQGLSMDLARQSFPTRHHDFVTADVDRDLLACNLAEHLSGRHRPYGLPGPSVWIAGPAFLELTASRRISIPGAHLSISQSGVHFVDTLLPVRPKTLCD